MQDEPLTIVGWLWKGGGYTVERANIWARLLDRQLTLPHRFVLVTDQPDAKFDPLIEPVPLWNDWRELKPADWGSRPFCYPRLKVFSAEFGDILLGLGSQVSGLRSQESDTRHPTPNTQHLTPRFVSIDLDCLPLAPLDPLFERDEDFLIIRRSPPIAKQRLGPYNASMFYMRAGARKNIWEEFKGRESMAAAARKYLGSDQSWLNFSLGTEKGWNQADGVYCFVDLYKTRAFKKSPPKDARIIFFNGSIKPWGFSNDTYTFDYPWIGEHYNAVDGQQVSGNRQESMRDISPMEGARL